MIKLYKIMHAIDAPKLEIEDSGDAALLNFMGVSLLDRWPDKGMRVRAIPNSKDLFSIYYIAPRGFSL